MLVSKRMLSVVAMASKDDSRPILEMVKLYKEDGKVVAVATDSYVLGEVIEEVPELSEYPELPHTPEDTDEVLLPAPVAKNLAKSIKGGSVLPVLSYGVVVANKATTTDLDTTVTLNFRPPEGNYPDYRKLVKEATDAGKVTALLDPKKLRQALEMFKDDTSVEISIQIDPMTGGGKKFAAVILKADNLHTKKMALVMPMKG